MPRAPVLVAEDTLRERIRKRRQRDWHVPRQNHLQRERAVRGEPPRKRIAELRSLGLRQCHSARTGRLALVGRLDGSVAAPGPDSLGPELPAPAPRRVERPAIRFAHQPADDRDLTFPADRDDDAGLGLYFRRPHP